MKAMVMIAALCLVSTGVAPPVAMAQSASLEQLRARGRAYHKRGMYKQAMSMFDKAYGTKSGSKDFETVIYRARTAYALLLLETAFEMAEKAEEIADGNRETRSARELKSEMTGLYGPVRVKAEQGETNAKGRIFFETKTGLINKEKKARFEAIQERFRGTDIALPRTVFLPYGKYTANNVPFEIVQGQPMPTVSVFLQVRQDEEDDDSALWWYVGAGGAAAIALGVGAIVLFAEPDPERVETRRLITN